MLIDTMGSGGYGEALFSMCFWVSVSAGGTYLEAFNYALDKNAEYQYDAPDEWDEPDDKWDWQNAQINPLQYHGHDFFAD